MAPIDDRGLLLKVLCGSVVQIIGGEPQSENSSMLYNIPQGVNRPTCNRCNTPGNPSLCVTSSDALGLKKDAAPGLMFLLALCDAKLFLDHRS